MAKSGKGWLRITLSRLLGSFEPSRFHNRQVKTLRGTRILVDSCGSPIVPIPTLDRLVARVTGTPLLLSLARRSGLDISHLQTMSAKNIAKMVRTLSGRRALELFYVDATTNNGLLLTALMEEHPEILEALIRSLTREERLWVLQLFGEPAPNLTEPAAENCAMILSRLNERKNIVPALTQLLKNSKAPSEAAALRGLYHSKQLDFGLLTQLNQAFQPGQGEDGLSTCFRNARKFNNPKLATHLQVFSELMNQSLPEYRHYWAQCTGLPAEDCPVSYNFPSLNSNLNRLTPSVVDQLCHVSDEAELVNLASQQGWKKIQSCSSATLRNPDAATGDFIFRTFSERQWQTRAP